MKKYFNSELIRTAVIILSFFLLLVVNREFGLADNGDFSRYILGFASKPVELNMNWPQVGSKEWHFRFFSQPLFYWSPAAEGTKSWFTSAALIWGVGEFLNNSLYSSNVIGMRNIGLPFFLLHLLGLIFIIGRLSPTNPKTVVAFLGTFIVMTDARITAFYNSFYAESLPILTVFLVFSFFMGRIFCFSKNQRFIFKEKLFALLIIGLLLLSIFAKRQYLYFLFPALLFLFYYIFYMFESKILTRIIVFLFFSIVILFASVFITKSQRISNVDELSASRITSYHALYYGLLPHSSNPEKVIEEIGLPPESKALIGESAWNENSSIFIDEQPNINLRSFISAIIVDPTAFGLSLLNNAKQVGNFDIPLGMVYGTTSQYPPKLISLPSVAITSISGQGLLLVVISLSLFLFVFPYGSSVENRISHRCLNVLLLGVILADIFVSTFDGQQEARKHVIISGICSILLIILAVSSFAGLFFNKNNSPEESI